MYIKTSDDEIITIPNSVVLNKVIKLKGKSK